MISPTLQMKGASSAPSSRRMFTHNSLRTRPPSSSCEHLRHKDPGGGVSGTVTVKPIAGELSGPHLRVQSAGSELPHGRDKWLISGCPSSRTAGITLLTAETQQADHSNQAGKVRTVNSAAETSWICSIWITVKNNSTSTLL